MNPECINSVIDVAWSMGKVLTQQDLVGMENRLIQARKQLQLKDQSAWAKMSEAQRIEAAGKMIVDQLNHEAIKVKQRAALTVIKEKERAAELEHLKSQGLDAQEALKRYNHTVGGRNSMEALEKGLVMEYGGRLEAFRDMIDDSSIAGIEISKKNGIDFVDEAFGKDTGNKLAKAAWKNVESVFDDMVAHFNRLGGDIPKLANYRFPQALDQYTVSKMKRDGFVKFMADLVDRDMYLNADGTFMDDMQLNKFLEEAYLTIVTGGDAKEKGRGTGTIANRNKAHRQIHYKSAEAYRAAMDKLGAGGPFDQISARLESLSRDIAMLEKWGPNPDFAFQRELQKASAETGRPNDPLTVRAWDRLTGKVTSENLAVSNFFGGVKSLVVSSRLGSMLFAQMSDLASAQGVARTLNIPLNQIAEWGARVSSDTELRRLLRLHGLGIESVMNEVARFAEGASSRGLLGKIATAIPTLQGAHMWTKAWRQAVGVMLEAHIGDLTFKYDFADIPAEYKLPLEQIGITAADWTIWRQAKPTEYKGSRLLSAGDIAKIDPDSAHRYAGFIIEQAQQAILQPGQLSAEVLANIRPGHIPSEVMSLITQFKSFPMAWLRQAFLERAEIGGQNPWVFRARLVAYSTVLGGVSLMLDDLANGRDPRKIYEEDNHGKSVEFGMQALLKGGGLGFFNEVIEAALHGTENPYQAGAKLLGPAIGHVVGDVIPALGKGIKATYTQDDKDVEAFTKYLYSSAKGVVPGQNLWFIKGFLHNIILDDLQEMANPGYKDRQERRNAENYGAGNWAEEGRAPDFNIMGESQ